MAQVPLQCNRGAQPEFSGAARRRSESAPTPGFPGFPVAGNNLRKPERHIRRRRP
jgi:hypothetical protein